MINKISILLLLLSVVCFSQDDKKQTTGAELPDFVNSGNENLPAAKKPNPNYVSIIAEDFLKPYFSSEQLEIKEFVNPIKENINLKDSVHYVSGRFSAGVGYYSLPVLGILYTNPYDGGIFEWYGSALNTRAYIPNSDKYDLNGGLNLTLFGSNSGSFLPGTEVKFHGGFDFDSYKFYASPLPETRRSLTLADFSVKADNFLNDYFVFSAEAGDEYSTLKNENYSENLANFKGFAKLRFSNFYLSGDVQIKKQYYTRDVEFSSTAGYFGINPKAGFMINDAMNAEVGFNYSNALSKSYFTPYASLAFRFDKSLSIFGEYDPHTEFLNSAWFLKKNPWFNTNNFVNGVVDYTGSFKAAIKYEFEKYYQINGGVKILTSSNLPYVANSQTGGWFDAAYTDGHIITAFGDLLFYTGPNGYFYGTADFTISSDTAKLRVPYIPWSDASLAYGYRFAKMKMDTEVKLKYTSDVYTDLLNHSKLNNNIDLGLKISYQYRPKFLITLELSNILFRKNYIWQGYEEMPFNITAGLNIIL